MRRFGVSLTIFFCFSQLSCHKEYDLHTVNVPSYLQQMLPYTEGQVVRYENTNGSVITAVVQKISFISEVYCAACNMVRWEELIQFKFKVGDKGFFIFQANQGPVILLEINSPTHNFQIGRNFDFETMEGVVGLKCTGPRQACVGNIILNGKTFNDVLRITNVGAPDQIAKAYYSVSKGLVGFEYGNGLTYHLLD